ncbi:hypothetical protein EMIT0347P_30635 [Pseudomonas sp. IT-347P]
MIPEPPAQAGGFVLWQIKFPAPPSPPHTPSTLETNTSEPYRERYAQTGARAFLAVIDDLDRHG